MIHPITWQEFFNLICQFPMKPSQTDPCELPSAASGYKQVHPNRDRWETLPPRLGFISENRLNVNEMPERIQMKWQELCFYDGFKLLLCCVYVVSMMRFYKPCLSLMFVLYDFILLFIHSWAKDNFQLWWIIKFYSILQICVKFVIWCRFISEAAERV